MQGADQGQVRKLEEELDPAPAPPDPWPDPLGLQGGRGGKRIGRRGAGEKQGQAGEDTGEGVVVNFENILHLAIGTVSTWHRELVEYEWIEQTHVSRHLLHPAHLRFLLQHSGGPCCQVARWPGGQVAVRWALLPTLETLREGRRFLEMCELPVSPSRCQQVSQLGLMMRPGGFSWVMVSDG